MTDVIDRTAAFCIVGAGASGIAAGKTFNGAGIPFDIIEREDEVGGNWYYGTPNSSVYSSTHLISSRDMTAYLDYPMPDDYPDYPNHEQVLAYLRDYARHFGLYEHIAFNTSVETIVPVEADKAGTAWDVTLSSGEVRRYRGVLIANGHHWDPKLPQFPGTFDGVSLHSANYKTPDVLAGKRVLVVGAGNSGCDIAVEAAQHAAVTYHSTRRGYWYAPKYVFGKPTDQVAELSIKLGVPLFVRRLINRTLLRILVGDVTRYGLKKPDHKLQEAHPIINQHITYYMGHGRIKPKPDVAELCGDSVRFADGSLEPIDVIVYATGFNITFPFIDTALLDWRDGKPDLYINAFHRRYDTLFVLGLIQPDSGQFWIVDLQARLMARFIQAIDAGAPAADDFRQDKARARPDLGGGIHYLNSTRHLLEIEHHSYRQHLKKHIRRMERALPSS